MQEKNFEKVMQNPVNAAFKPEMTYEESLAENKKIVKLLVDFFG